MTLRAAGGKAEHAMSPMAGTAASLNEFHCDHQPVCTMFAATMTPPETV
jgi:hypothetical protein